MKMREEEGDEAITPAVRVQAVTMIKNRFEPAGIVTDIKSMKDIVGSYLGAQRTSVMSDLTNQDYFSGSDSKQGIHAFIERIDTVTKGLLPVERSRVLKLRLQGPPRKETELIDDTEYGKLKEVLLKKYAPKKQSVWAEIESLKMTR